MKILIISFCFPPYNSVACVRVGKIAKYLEKFGHEIKVIAASDNHLLKNLDLEISPENVVYTKWMRIAPRTFYNNVQSLMVKRSFLHKLKHKFLKMIRSILCFPDPYIGWTPYLMKWANNILGNWRADVILVSASPHSSLITASIISKRYKIPWVADLRDLWSDNHCYAFGNIRRAIERKIEDFVLSSATGITTVSEPLAQKLRSRFNIPIGVVCNGFDPDDYALFPGHERRDNNAKLRIVYTGRIYNDFQDPLPLFQALKRFDKNEIKVSFYGTLSPFLHNLAKTMEIEDKVEFVDAVPYKESLSIQRNADVLLYLLWTDISEKGMYSGKIFEYLGAGRTLLAIGPDSGVAADLIKGRKLGVILNSSDDIYLQLKKWLKEKDEKGFIPSSPLESRYGYTREEQTKKLEMFIKEVLKK